MHASRNARPRSCWRQFFIVKRCRMSRRDLARALLSNKNKVAHGQPCSVTLKEVLADYKNSKRVITTIDRIVKFV